MENPNRFVTKEDLKNFYDSIFPYLGGMPEVLANKFSKSDLYSTDEKMIGQWVDGKPLYQRNIATTFKNGTIMALENGIEVKKLEAYMFHDVNTIQANPFFYSATNYWSVYLNNGEIMGRCADAYANKNIQIILQYTKTADLAVSIGEDTDYSIEEKVVGTWIDGKPIYQKTIETTTPTCSTQGTVAEKYIELGVEVDKFISIDGFFRIPNNAQISNASDMPLNAVFKAGSTITYSLVRGTPHVATNNADTIFLSVSNTNWSARTCYITVQYTKTTT